MWVRQGRGMGTGENREHESKVGKQGRRGGVQLGAGNSVGTRTRAQVQLNYDAQKIILRRIAVSLGYCSRILCCGTLTLTPCSIPSGSFVDMRASRS